MVDNINNKRIAKNTIFLYIRMLLVMLVTLYTSRIILGVLGFVDFGIYNVVAGVITFFSFLNGSMAASTSRFLTIELGNQDLARFKKVYSVTVLNHFVLGVFIVILAETIGLWFLQNKLVIPADRIEIAFWLYQFSIFSTFISIIQVPFGASIIAHEKMNIYALGGIIESLLKLGTAFLIGFITFDRLGFYGIAISCTAFIMIIFYYLYIKKKFPYCNFEMQTDKALYRETLSYSGWDLLGNFSIVAQGQGLNMLLNIFFGPLVNAAQAISMQVQAAILQFANNFMLASRPQIIKYYASGENKKMMNLVFHSAKYSFYLMWLLSLPILIETEYVLEIWLKKVPLNTVSFTRIVILTSLITSLRNPFIAAMHATGKIKLPNLVCGTLLISTVPISYFFLKQGYPAESVFIISLVITFISMWIELILIKRAVYFSILDVISKIIIISMMVVLLSVILPVFIYYQLEDGFLRFCLVSFFSILSVFTAVYFIGIGKNERAILASNIKNKN